MVFGLQAQGQNTAKRPEVSIAVLALLHSCYSTFRDAFSVHSVSSFNRAFHVTAPNSVTFETLPTFSDTL